MKRERENIVLNSGHYNLTATPMGSSIYTSMSLLKGFKDLANLKSTNTKICKLRAWVPVMQKQKSWAPFAWTT